MLRRIIVLASVLSAFDANVLSQAERNFAIQALQDTRKQFLEAVTSLSDRRWSFKPGPDRWSIGQIAEHLALTEDRLFHDVLGSLKRNEPDPGSKKPPDEAQMRDVKSSPMFPIGPSRPMSRHVCEVQKPPCASPA